MERSRAVIRINYISDLLYPFALIIFITPAMLWQSPTVYIWFGRLRKVMFFYTCFLYIQKKMYKNTNVNLCLLFFVYLLVVSYAVSGRYAGAYDLLAQSSGLIILSAYVAKNNLHKFTMYTGVVLSLWIILNALTWKEGGAYITVNGQIGTFLGVSTTITQYQIPALLFISLARQHAKNEKTVFFSIVWAADVAAVVIAFLQNPCTTSILVLGVGLILTYAEFLPRFAQPLFQTLSYKKYEVLFWVLVALNIGFIFFDMQNIFAGFIENILHESGDLNNRKPIWAVVIAQIATRPIWGNGLDLGTTFSFNQHTSYNTSAHNQILSFLFYGGIIGTSYFLYIVHRAFSSIRKIADQKIARLVAVAFVSYGLLWFSEQFNQYGMFMLCMIAAFFEVSLHENTSKGETSI